MMSYSVVQIISYDNHVVFVVQRPVQFKSERSVVHVPSRSYKKNAGMAEQKDKLNKRGITRKKWPGSEPPSHIQQRPKKNGGCDVLLVRRLSDTKMAVPAPIAKIPYRRRVVPAAGTTAAARGECPRQETALLVKICER